MNTNRTYVALAAVITAITLGVGAFLLVGSSGATAPAAPSTEQSITVKARDTNAVALNGVVVQVTGPGNTKVTSGTITTGGQISLSFDPEPGTYVVTATEPTGYHARDDKDGGASDVNGLPCSNVYLCIYLTATEMQDTTGTKSIVVTLAHVRPEQVDELDDLWFEMSPPGAAEEEISFIDPADDDILIGEPVNDELDDAGSDQDDNQATPDEDDDVLIDDQNDEVASVQPGLGQFCVNVVHQAVAEQDALSGIWVRGQVYGLDSGWIFVEGPTINNGAPLQIEIEDSRFDTPLGINQFGDHQLDQFELQSNDPTIAPVDLLPTLNEGPGAIFPVDSNEGPVFDNECFDFDAPEVGDPNGSQPADVPQPTDEEQAEQTLADATAEVDTFLAGFVANHVAGNSSGLLDTLHPAIPLAFGDDTCTEYVTRTTGSITGANVLTVDQPTTIEMDTPNGAISFPEAIPFTVEFTLGDGTTVVNDANLADFEGESQWLTRCGFDG